MSDNFLLMIFDNLWGDDDKEFDKDLEELPDMESSNPEDIDREESEKE